MKSNVCRRTLFLFIIHFLFSNGIPLRFTSYLNIDCIGFYDLCDLQNAFARNLIEKRQNGILTRYNMCSDCNERNTHHPRHRKRRKRVAIFKVVQREKETVTFSISVFHAWPFPTSSSESLYSPPRPSYTISALLMSVCELHFIYHEIFGEESPIQRCKIFLLSLFTTSNTYEMIIFTYAEFKRWPVRKIYETNFVDDPNYEICFIIIKLKISNYNNFVIGFLLFIVIGYSSNVVMAMVVS
ncbi:LOW QUALITY PROTEIN: hypothetical protein V1477_021323 [Vespula maculifrons]|uniref:Uncharacterized protein n=1 Tax=Vespula maculifrons TaxID=7453 RepID=A0ABD2AGT2_VESMC